MKKLVLIEPVWQTIWQWPAVVNLICGGTASGFYLITMIVGKDTGASIDFAGFQVAHLAAPLLVLIGFAAVGVEAARPSAAKYLLHHLRTSWMSREVLAGSLFVLFSVLDVLLPGDALRIAAALSAVGLLLSQAMMIFRCKAVTTWNQSIVLLHFLASGIYLGFGLLLILGLPAHQTISPGTLLIGLIASIVSLMIWHRYIFAAGKGVLNQPLGPLRKTMPLTLTIGLGHMIPLAMILIFLICAAFEFDSKFLTDSYTLAGLTIVLGGSAQKYCIILKVNILREVFAEACAKQPAL